MNGSDLRLSDWHRILLGDVPAGYLLEAIFRAAFIYVVLMVAMRLLGRRMASQLSQTELAALVSLAAAVGIPLLTPDRGLLIAVVIAAVIVVIGRVTASLSLKSPSFEAALQGKVSVLVNDSVLMLPAMHRTRVTRERVFAKLRSQGVRQLGEVKRLFLEANGSFSLVKEDPPIPGLSVIPDWDQAYASEQHPASETKICAQCGQPTRDAPPHDPCPSCGARTWVTPVT